MSDEDNTELGFDLPRSFTELCHTSYDPMTGKTVEAKVWAEACSLLYWVPNPAPKLLGGDAAGRWQDPSFLLYLFGDASSSRTIDLACLLHSWATARFHVTITSSSGDWCCVLQVVSRLQRSYCRKVIRRLPNVQLKYRHACPLPPRLGFERDC